MIDGYNPSADAPLRVRAMFISDTHFGTRDCRAEALLELLRRTEAKRIYLIGDIVDGWRLKARWYWPPSHDAVIRHLLQTMETGTRILYVPGNHDEFLRASAGLSLGGVQIVEQAIHRGADGRSHLVIHGDQFDAVVGRMRHLAALGIWVYAVAVLANDALNRWRRRLVRSTGANEARNRAFQRLAIAEARRQRLDGVICGHVHEPALMEVAGVQYLNTGDWVNSCSAAVEHLDGTFQLLHCPSPVREGAWEGAVAAPAAGRAG